MRATTTRTRGRKREGREAGDVPVVVVVVEEWSMVRCELGWSEGSCRVSGGKETEARETRSEVERAEMGGGDGGEWW